MAEYRTLQDCLDQCARYELAVDNCITRMNDLGLTTPTNATLRQLPSYLHYNGTLKPEIPVSVHNPVSFDDASTGITNIQICKENLKAAINKFCYVTGRQITNDLIDDYYTYLQRDNVSFVVEYLEIPSSGLYFQLDFKFTNYSKINAKVKWGGFTSTHDNGEMQRNMLIGNYGIPSGTSNRYFSGITAKQVTIGTSSTTRMAAGIGSCYIGSQSTIDVGKYILNPAVGTSQAYTITNLRYEDSYIKDSVNGTAYSDDNRSGSIHPSYVGNVMVFNNWGCPANSRFYYLQDYEGSTLAHDIVPMKKWNGTSWVGFLYDRVTGKIYNPSGSGNFTIGPNIYP